MHSRRTVLPGLLAALTALLAILSAFPVNVVSGYIPAAVTSHRWLWVGLLAGLTLVMVWLAWLAGRVTQTLDARLWQVPQVSGWVDRAELVEVVSTLASSRDGTVAVTTGLVGAGGFGKTMLAAQACQHRTVRRRFRGGIVWVTVGREIAGAALAVRIGEVIGIISGQAPTFTSPEQAGQALAEVLATRGRTLLVADDVWTAAQLEPFASATQAGRLLVTTRRPGVLVGIEAHEITVDALTRPVALRLLRRQLPTMADEWEKKLLGLTGGWPLLLSLVNRRLADEVGRRGATIDMAAADAAMRLQRGGPQALDITDSGSRMTAVAATMDYSLDTLDAFERDRFSELAVFAEDAEVPLAVIGLLWNGSSGLSLDAAEPLCERLDGLSLLTLTWAGQKRVIVIHDVIRGFVVGRLGAGRLSVLNGVLLDMVAGSAPTAGASSTAARVAWWDVVARQGDRYWLDHLTEHLLAAGRVAEAEAVVCDLRWAGMRVQASGPPALAADFVRVGTQRAVRLGAVLARVAHLLAPTEPADAVLDILHSRVANDPEWGPQVADLEDSFDRPRLANQWPLPDLPAPELRRVLMGHTDWVSAVAVAPDGTWLATGSRDRTVRIWDAATGRQRGILTGHGGSVSAVAVAPDGTWLVTASIDGTVRIWDAATGRQRGILTGHAGPVRAVAVAPDGSWLATGSIDRTVRIWDAATGQARGILTGHKSSVSAVAVATDGTWLASGSADGSVLIWDIATGQQRVNLSGHTNWVNAITAVPGRPLVATSSWDGTAAIWDAVTGQRRATFTGHDSPVRAVAVAPNGSWLATGGIDGTVRVWDAVTGQQRASLAGHNDWVNAVAVAPDGSWLATGSGDGTVMIWDAVTGQQRASLAGHNDWVNAVAVAPNGSWLATGGIDGTVRVWDAVTGQQRASLAGHGGAVNAVAVAPDGSWLATGGIDGTVRVWDAVTGQQRASLAGHGGAVNAVAVAPDGSWLATGGIDGTVRVWDAVTGQQRASLAGHGDAVNAVAVAPDGSWLATGGIDGTVRVWDAVTGQQRASLAGHGDAVNAVAVAPDGSWLATGGIDGTVRVWDAVTGQQRASLAGHGGAVNAVAVAPDGSWLATGGIDRTVTIWDAASWQSRALMRVENSVLSSAWVDGRCLVVGGPAGLYLFSFLTGTTSPPSLLTR